MSPISATPAVASPVPTPKPAREVLSFAGSGLYSEFTVTASDHSYGRAAGYASLGQAIGALSHITSGTSAPAAGIFKEAGRYVAHPLRVRFDYDDKLGGYSGAWKLEQHPDDRSVFVTDDPMGEITIDPTLRFVVDGKVNIDAKKIAAL